MNAAAVVEQFTSAWDDHDLDAALTMLTDDCVFEATSPPPDGMRCEGREAIRVAWRPIFADTAARFEVEQTIVAGAHVTQLWRYEWLDGHVRGIDVFLVRADQIAEKLSYVKG